MVFYIRHSQLHCYQLELANHHLHKLVSMHTLLEYLPLIVFFVVYKMVDIYWATGSIIVVMLIQTIFYIASKKPIPTRHWVIFAMVTFFGALTIFFHDDTFIKWKVTVIYGLFAIVLLVSDLAFNKNIIKQFLSEALTLPELIWRKLNTAWALFFASLAIVNIYIAYNFSQEFWVNFKVFGATIATIVFAFASVLALYKHFPDDEVDEQENK